MKVFGGIFAAILFFFLLLFVYTKLVGAFPLAINSITTTKSDLFQVDGTGKASAPPNTAVISFGVSKTASALSDAEEQANSVNNTILQDLKSLGIADKNIQTTNYSVTPNIDFSSGKSVPNGYTVTENLEVKITPTDKVNQAISKVVGDGANMVGGIQFTLDDQTQKNLEQQAREQAVQNAKDKAESLATAAGIHLGRVVDVQEANAAPRPIVEPMMAANDLKAAPVTPEVAPGENNIEVTVTLSYQTY